MKKKKKKKMKEFYFNTVRKLSVDLVVVDYYDYELENVRHQFSMNYPLLLYHCLFLWRQLL
jgi:hypothetical protein